MNFLKPAEKHEDKIGNQVKLAFNLKTKDIAASLADAIPIPIPSRPPGGGPPPKEGPPKEVTPKELPKEGEPKGVDPSKGPPPGESVELPEPVKKEIRTQMLLLPVRAILMIFFLALGPFPVLVLLLTQILGRNGVVLVMRSITRNLLRTSLSYLATFVLSFVICAVFSVLGFLDAQTEEKSANLKTLVTEKNQIPSQMPPKFESDVVRLIEELGKQHPQVKLTNGDADIMTWAFVGGTTDPKNRTFMNSLFFFAMEPSKVLTMLEGLDELTTDEREMLEKGVAQMEENKRGIIVGSQRLKMMQKRVGDRMQLTSLNYKDLVFDMEILGTFPEGSRYDQSAVMHREYLYKALEEYEGKFGAHPLADKCLNLIWIRLPTREAFEIVAAEVNKSGRFSPAVKMETASSGISSFLDAFKDMLWFMRYLLCPALLVVMALVISNAISISVRERRTEMAVLKVLGYPPWMVMSFVLGEALLIGALSGFMATATAFAIINAMGGFTFPIAFFGKFFVPASALWWGPALGAGAAFVGSFLPAWTARSVKVSEVFSKVA